MTNSKSRSEQKQALITGCDYGLGAELAKAAMARGYHVFAACLKPAAAEAVRAFARERGYHPTVLKMDMSSESDIRRACAGIARKTDRIDMIVNNAAMYFTDGI